MKSNGVLTPLINEGDAVLTWQWCAFSWAKIGVSISAQLGLVLVLL